MVMNTHFIKKFLFIVSCALGAHVFGAQPGELTIWYASGEWRYKARLVKSQLRIYSRNSSDIQLLYNNPVNLAYLVLAFDIVNFFMNNDRTHGAEVFIVVATRENQEMGMHTDISSTCFEAAKIKYKDLSLCIPEETELQLIDEVHYAQPVPSAWVDLLKPRVNQQQALMPLCNDVSADRKKSEKCPSCHWGLRSTITPDGSCWACFDEQED
jgi:hypothetical protein